MQASLEVAGHASSEACVRGHLRKRPHRDPPPPAAAETDLLGKTEAGVAGFEGEFAGGAVFFLRCNEMKKTKENPSPTTHSSAGAFPQSQGRGGERPCSACPPGACWCCKR